MVNRKPNHAPQRSIAEQLAPISFQIHKLRALSGFTTSAVLSTFLILFLVTFFSIGGWLCLAITVLGMWLLSKYDVPSTFKPNTGKTSFYLILYLATLGWISSTMLVLHPVIVGALCILCITIGIAIGPSVKTTRYTASCLLMVTVMTVCIFQFGNSSTQSGTFTSASPINQVIPPTAAQAPSTDINRVEQAVVTEPIIPETKVMTKEEAKEFAETAYQQLRQYERDLQVAVQTNDYEGYRKHIWGPLHRLIGSWPSSRDPGNEAMELYSNCFLAASSLLNVGRSYTLESGIERVREVEEHSGYFDEHMTACKAAIDRN